MPVTISQISQQQAIWVPIEDTVTVYVGGIVSLNTSALTEGVAMLPDSAGAFNVTNKDVPFGVCLATNRKEPLYSSTYKCEYITGPAAADPHDGASIEYVGVEGPWAKGDPIPMVKVALIDPTTILRASLFKSAVGTPPTVVTVTVGSTDGLGCTTGSIDFTGIAVPLQTFYFRSGANKGTYRMSDSASATVHTWDTATRNDIAIGDTLVAVPCRTHGLSTVMFDATTASYIDVADAPVAAGTARWAIQVLRLDLSVPGQEWVEFRFDTCHLTSANTNVGP